MCLPLPTTLYLIQELIHPKYMLQVDNNYNFFVGSTVVLLKEDTDSKENVE